MPSTTSTNFSLTMREYQAEGNRDIRRFEALYPTGTVVVQGPTGCGKTVCIADLLTDPVEQLVLTDRKVLFAQLHKYLTEWGIPHGCRAAGYTTTYNVPIQIAMVQTEEARGLPAMPNCRRIIIDEVHKNNKGMVQRAIKKYGAHASKIGFTATPSELGHFADELIVMATVRELTEQGYLTPHVVYGPLVPDMELLAKARRQVNGDYAASDVEKFYPIRAIFGRMIDTWKEHNPLRLPTIGFCSGVPQSLWAAQHCNSYGIPSVHVDCVDRDTEYLSETGWKSIAEYDGGKVMQVNSDYTMEWVFPDEYIVAPCKYLNYIRNEKGVDQVFSDGHDLVRCYSEFGPLNKVTGDKFIAGLEAGKKNLGRFACCGVSLGGVGFPLSDDQLRVQVAVHADGCIRRTSRCEVGLKKERKIIRLRLLLQRAGIGYSETVRKDGTTWFYFRPPCLTKHFGPDWYSCSSTQLDIVADEVLHWDGCNALYDDKWVRSYSSMDRGDVDFIQYAFCATGRRASIGRQEKMAGILWTLNIAKSKTTGLDGRTATFGRKYVPPDGKKYCFVVPSGMLLLRRKGCIAITGNCKNIWMDGCFLPTDDDNLDLVRYKMEKGDIKIVFNRYLLREGVDWPFLKCALLTTAFGSRQSFVQAVGRILRLSDNASEAIVIDNGGNWLLHPPIDSDLPWDWQTPQRILAAERVDDMREGKVPEPIRCSKCNAIRVEGNTCPKCGFTSHQQSRWVLQVNGKLKLVHGKVFRPRRTEQTPNLQRIYIGKLIGNRQHYPKRTISQIVANMARENNWIWPDPSMKGMPKTSRAFHIPVGQLTADDLIQGEEVLK